MLKVDWEKRWEEKFEERQRLLREDDTIEYWSKRSEDYSDSRRTNNYEYGHKVLSTLMRYEVLRSDSEVLEIGPGPGTFIIPFARKIKKITAVEPADGMIKKIKENAEEEGIENYEIIHKKWQEVDVTKIIQRYNLAICSLVIWMFKDVFYQIERMEQSSKEYCCIVTGTGNWDGEDEKLWQEIMGNIKKPDYGEYPLIYNILYNKGRLPNVRIVDYTSERSVKNMVAMKTAFFDRYIEITPEVEKIIEEHVLKNSDGKKCRKEAKAAVIWWKVHYEKD